MRILMVSTEYPPISGGVGRYTANLTEALKKLDQEVFVACEEKGNGDYKIIDPVDTKTSERLSRVVDSIKPEVVHIQFEPGLYGLHLDPINPNKCSTNLDDFYDKCKIPIITTFHSGYTFREWTSQVSMIKKTGRTGRMGIPARFIVKSLKNITHYKSFVELNKNKLRQSYAGICFSEYMQKLLGKKSHVIYHGAESSIKSSPSKDESRRYFSISSNNRFAVTVGFKTITKGWDILYKIKLPDNWMIISNSTKGHYNKEVLIEDTVGHEKIIDLQRGYLTEKELSLLFFASDAILLPYKITSGSGVMFDALAHGLPFVSSNLEFFKEFAEMGLGITCKRNPKSFGEAISTLTRNYERYSLSVNQFKEKLRWENIADQHLKLYSDAKENLKHNTVSP